MQTETHTLTPDVPAVTESVITVTEAAAGPAPAPDPVRHRRRGPAE